MHLWVRGRWQTTKKSSEEWPDSSVLFHCCISDRVRQHRTDIALAVAFVAKVPGRPTVQCSCLAETAAPDFVRGYKATAPWKYALQPHRCPASTPAHQSQWVWVPNILEFIGMIFEQKTSKVKGNMPCLEEYCKNHIFAFSLFRQRLLLLLKMLCL